MTALKADKLTMAGEAKTTVPALSSSHRRTRLDGLTTCRFFAAALVVFHHNKDTPAFQSAPTWFLRFIHNGYAAVSFFFLLSGFVLVYAYYRPDQSNALKGTRREFWAARIARIYPIYVIALVLAVPLFLAERFKPDSPFALSFLAPLVTAPALLQAWIPPAALSWNGPGWSLSVEAFFYLTFPLLADRMVKLKPRTALAFSLLFLVVFQITLYAVFPLPESGAPDLPNTRNMHFFTAYFPLNHLPTFILGMALGTCFLSLTSLKSPWIANLVFVVTALTVCTIFSLHGLLSPFFLSSVCLVPLFGILVFSLACSGGWLEKAVSQPALVRLGDASYTMYILHIPLAWWMNHARIKTPALAQMNDLAFFGCYFAVLTACCLFTYSFVEKPLRKLISQRIVAISDC
jgi:peptidoglycan/LPS O-acetylase OafA/YrhL